MTMNVEVSRLGANEGRDLESLTRIFRDVFEQDGPAPSLSYLSALLRNPDFVVIVARADGQVVGGLTAFVLHLYYEERPSAYIYDVGVGRDYQGRGVGTSLMAFAGEYFRQQGFREAFVQAERDDAEAVRFYRTTAFSDESDAIQFARPFS